MVFEKTQFMSRTAKAVLLGVLVGLVGLVLSPLQFMVELEEDLGMGLLFKVRGAKQTSGEAIVVSIDKESSEKLGLPNNPDKWPRSLHARLTEILVQEGARVIAFDVHFIEPRAENDDLFFARALEKASNVVLCEQLRLKEMSLDGSRAYDPAGHSIVQVVPPIDLFSDAVVATAPFTLPRIPFKVSQYWTFETAAGDSPTIPAIVLQLFAMDVYPDFVALLDKASSGHVNELQDLGDGRFESRPIKEMMKKIREIFESDPLVGEKMLKLAGNAWSRPADSRKHDLIKALIKMYSGGSSRYINFYGPPGTIDTVPYYQALHQGEYKFPRPSYGPAGTIDTVPYYQALQQGEKGSGGPQIDFEGKAVFVGLSEVLLAERKDSFYTVFSQANGAFISGVEIMATAFSNLFADTPLKKAGLTTHIVLILLWGVILGVICLQFSVRVALLGSLGMSTLYFLGAFYQFKSNAIAYPIVVPLFLQTPMAFFGGLAWNYIDANKQLKNIKDAFGHYLPKDVVSRLAKDVTHIRSESKMIEGVCLMTDAQQFTSLSENMDPQELRGFMNRYYEQMFQPVKKYGGIVSGVTGDSMLALWVAARSDVDIRTKACCAAREINQTMRQFKQKNVDTVNIKTRIGVHYGQIILGNIGALDHYQYTPMGDIVNTASRIESLNKYLGTTLLVSAEVLDKIEESPTR